MPDEELQPESPRSTILIVDDEPVGRRILEVLLADQGYALVTVGSGLDALNQAQQSPPDLILLDIMMPDMDGFEVCLRLRSDPMLAEVPVIMVTALDDRESRLRGIEVGADDFITKPVDRVELRKRVQTIVRLDRYRRLLNERNQRQQAEEEIRQRNRELTLLNNVITAAASTLDVSRVLHIACEALTQAFELPCALSLLLNDEQTYATVAAEYVNAAYADMDETDGPDAPAVLPHQREPLMGKVFSLDTMPALATMLAEKTPLSSTDARADPRFASARPFLQAHGAVSLLMVPILMRDQVVGCICLSATRQHTFAHYDFTMAQGVATAAGQAMETAQLYQQLQRHADHLEETVHQRTLELQIERDRTRNILEALGEAVIVTNREGIIEYINPAATDLTGFNSRQMLGQNWNDFQGEKQADLALRIQNSVHTGSTWRGEVIYKRQDGSPYDSALTVAPIFDPHLSGSIIGVVTVMRDITPLKQAERLKDQFVSNVSHELRTPLTVITLLSGNLDRLFDRLEPEKRQQMIRDIREHTKVLNDLISSVLEISRIDSRRISTQHQPLNLVQLVHEEIERQLPLVQRNAQTLQVGGVEQLCIMGNDGQLRQIIRNVLNNAIKYTPHEGKIWCECRLWGAAQDEQRRAKGAAAEPWDITPLLDTWPGSDILPAGNWAALRIVDTGMGINSEDLPHIFERFYRVHRQGNIPGTGLGLSIAQDLINLHSGQIAIDSTPNQGSTVAIYLPLATTDCY